MTALIRETRRRRSVGVRELARRCGVAAPTVVGWERSEEAGTIQVETLHRALAAMGSASWCVHAPKWSNSSRLHGVSIVSDSSFIARSR